MRLEPGARATLSDVTFRKNTVATGKPDAVASGPVMGLYAGLTSGASAAWFHNCSFGEHTSAVAGEVSVENSNCRVYSNTKLPTVWDLNLQRELNAWPLAPADSASSENVDVFAEVEAGNDFLRPTDELFVRIVTEQAQRTRLPAPDVPALPDGTEFITRDPYSGIEEDDGFWTARNIGLIVGLGGGALLLAIAALLAAWWFCFRKNSDVDKVCACHLWSPTATPQLLFERPMREIQSAAASQDVPPLSQSAIASQNTLLHLIRRSCAKSDSIRSAVYRNDASVFGAW